MARRRKIPEPLAVRFATHGLIWLAVAFGAADVYLLLAPSPVAAPVGPGPSGPAAVARGAAGPAPAPPAAPAEVSPAPAAPAESPDVPLLGEDWALATIDALLAQHGDLALSPDEVAGLKDVYLYVQNVRTAYEAEIAQVSPLTPTLARIRIPPYPEAGARLQRMWEEELANELGGARSAEVDAQLGDTFHVAFKAFGAGAQELDVELKRERDGRLMYRIVARLDFADLTDPELGRDETRLFSTRASYVLPAETVATGEWRPLARFFPRLPAQGPAETP